MANEMKSRFFDRVGEVPHDDYYPRPQLERDNWMNLNGKWQYAIYPSKETFQGYQGEILVPFSPEALLSGVMETVTPDDTLYYCRTFNVDESFLKDKTLLHFGAVDYECRIYVNNQYVGMHFGGFLPFSMDITDYITVGSNVLELKVWDPTDTSYHAHGKQSSTPGNIWYTPQSGIWQTVWMESVSNDYVEDLKIVPDIDAGTVSVTVTSQADTATVEVLDGPNVKVIKKVDLTESNTVVIPMETFECWSPENPKLYNLLVLTPNDSVISYFGMRKFGVERDSKGVMRLFLNNEPYFHNGVLDQGYWSDGKLTPPSDEAMEYDIKKLKDMGFNMIRKHIKIEPLRWYYHCDRLGMLVWQDMVNGGRRYNFFAIGLVPFFNINVPDNHYKFFSRQDKKGREEYYKEMHETVSLLKNVTSLAMWVPFNEGWGQFDSDAVSEELKRIDPTRTIDRTSGWHDQKGSDFVSKHIYFYPVYVPKDDRCYLLSEFGGFSKMTFGHMYNKLLFGYRMYFSENHLTRGYEKTFEKRIIANIPKGLSATVFTQVSDVEGEVNGLMTYDRMVDKFNVARLKAVNDRVKL